uniref:Uncharacterized protein n=1 Tax=Arundo donax TaxID=35708 RepID=A0A0A8YTW4_ARUDO
MIPNFLFSSGPVGQGGKQKELNYSSCSVCLCYSHHCSHNMYNIILLKA